MCGQRKDDQHNRPGDRPGGSEPEPPTQTLNEVVAESWEARSTFDARRRTGEGGAATWAVAIV